MAEVAERGAPVLTRARMNVVFGTVMLGMLLAALDQTIVSTALPTVVGDLGGAGHMSWVVTSYLLAETVSTVIAGKFGDLFGRKRVFQVSVLLFVVGSFFCGLAESMGMLIAMRAVQGLGGGGITVTAMALIGDVIPLRDRGRYQGALGAVFGVTTVVGPLLGGYFTDSLSWRWAFYVNVPVAIVVIVAAARTIPGVVSGLRPRIDYLGVLFVALGASGLTLATSWGGTQYPWGSATIVGLYAASVAALVVFVAVELRAAEPILPMRLFRSPVFSIASLLSFIVGFAMLGALTFLPSYLQYVGGASATMSGVRTLPMVLGLLITALASGNVVGRTGRYKPFPIAGTAVMAVGLYLLSTMDENTSVAVQSVAMFVLGAGIGLVMQVLTIVVQNSAEYRDLGSATSGVTFFRTLGSSFGASIMGTFFASRLDDVLPAAIARSGITDPAAVASPLALHRLPEAQRLPVVQAYAESLHTVFLYAVPVALVGLLVAFLLPQVEMRGVAKEAVRGAGEGFGMPDCQDADAQLETVVGRVLGGRRSAAPEVLARSGVGVDLATAWGLGAVFLHGWTTGEPVRQQDVEDRVGLPHGVLTSFFDGLVDAGHLRRDGAVLGFTAEGRAVTDAITAAWRDWLVEQVREWLPGRDRAELAPKVRAVVERIARRAMIEEQDRALTR
ncbi:MDR family MFS transporter [Actinosynnema sp. NPDC020468]|uniref:MDR family MFS transporter n=1 Tax=Actinosynnema sp. NPDC020468 TaxID=3154488 RepID=UPI0033C0C8BE